MFHKTKVFVAAILNFATETMVHRVTIKHVSDGLEIVDATMQ